MKRAADVIYVSKPVSIDTFIKAVQDPGAAKPSGKFMTSFKAFLDKQVWFSSFTFSCEVLSEP